MEPASGTTLSGSSTSGKTCILGLCAAGATPGARDSSLQSWASLSPPSNFQLPEGFEPGLSPDPTARRKQQPTGPSDFKDLLDKLPLPSVAALPGTGLAVPPHRAAASGTVPQDDAPLMADKDVHELAFEFGSLLGTGGTPSWLMPPGADRTTTKPAAQPGPGERAFAALFGD